MNIAATLAISVAVGAAVGFFARQLAKKREAEAPLLDEERRETPSEQGRRLQAAQASGAGCPAVERLLREGSALTLRATARGLELAYPAIAARLHTRAEERFAKAALQAKTKGGYRYRVRAGDLPFKLAAHYTGDQARWRELRAINPGFDPRRLMGEILLPVSWRAWTKPPPGETPLSYSAGELGLPACLAAPLEFDEGAAPPVTRRPAPARFRLKFRLRRPKPKRYRRFKLKGPLA